MKRLSFLIMIIAMALAVVSCTSPSPASNSNQAASNSNLPEQQAAQEGVVVTEPAPGFKVEEKNFQTGEKIVRTTNPDGSRRVIIYQRGYESPNPVKVDDPGTIERAMELTVDETKEIIAKAAGATKEAGKTVGDKAEDAGKAIGEGAKRGAEEVKDAAGDAASATGKAVKKTGSTVKKIGEKIKN